MSKTIILIPSRLSATRLPKKPLLKINNFSIIQHVYKRALESGVGKVYVATGDIDPAALDLSNFVVTSATVAPGLASTLTPANLVILLYPVE